MHAQNLGLIAVAISLSIGVAAAAPPAKSTGRMIGVNVVLKQDITDAVLTDISRFGKVRDTLYEIDALTLQAREADLPQIQSLPYVAAANPDAERNGAPVDAVPVPDFAGGISTWNLDAANVADLAAGRCRLVRWSST